MLLSEMVRNLREENYLVDDATERSTNSTTWVTVASYNITLSKASMLQYCYEIYYSYYATAYIRLKIGSVFVGGEKHEAASWVKKTGFFALNAGNYTVELQLRVTSSGYYAKIRNFVLGTTPFHDMAIIVLRGSGSAGITLSKRKTCVGETVNGTLCIQVYNEGAAPTVTVDEVTLSAESSDGYRFVYTTVVSLGASHTVNVSAGYYAVVLSPWLLPKRDSELFSLSFPQGSTIYIMLEPAWLNPTKTVKIGKKRVISFGDSTDFYYTVSGTDILTASYTFETVEVSNCIMLVSGFGGCISIIGVDVR